MTDTVSPAPTPETGLRTALEQSLSPVVDLSLDDCLRRKKELLGDARSFQELTPEELEEFHALSMRLRQLAQPAGKPAARPKGAKPAPVSAAAVLDDFS